MPDYPTIIAANMPNLRGKVLYDAPLAPFTWFRVGGKADVLFTPEDADDLSYFLQKLSVEIPVMVLGLGSNIIIRDGGIRGVVIRLKEKAFQRIEICTNYEMRVGAGVPDVKVARAAAEAGIDGFSFLRGIPGSMGGAVPMNAGAHGGELKDRLVSARGVDRAGVIHLFTAEDMRFAYRKAAGLPADVMITDVLLRGFAGESAQILADMEAIAAQREATQPIKERTGGSTFKNPLGFSAWKLIDEAGCRGLRRGGAQVSPMHCNFLVNTGAASAADLENLGEDVRARVKAHSGVELQWEVKRVGEKISSV